ncbi:hypothetical protein PFISCL1PPCAC_8338 [Pristionchus fissidentatus]|uniref:Major facilitator superfamily (MFS) profile domain-containing protein n=1 Tax=Pristionchus fissidentatus TaxID=1538716 RepID=A0AAV5VBH8_9BILA|nr:hypothetical protein PFISCL1PPCAC_8338 [Pristionchus fissidentatus]
MEFGTRTRFIVMVLLLFCLTSIWSNILAFNFALICMKPIANATDADVNEDRYGFSEYQRMIMTSVVAIAALLANFPVVSMVNRFGVRTVFVVLGLVSAVGTLAMPFAVRMGYAYIIACRFLQGLGFAGNFPVIGDFAAKWTYYKQTGLFVSVLVAYVQLSPAVTMPTSGALCTSFGWPSIFFAHGVACLALFIALAAFYRNSPGKHPFVGEVEENKIAVGKATVDKKLLKKVPYAAILTTPAIWGTWIAAIGNFTAVAIMFLYTPLYLSSVLGFSMQNTGLTAAIPPMIQFTVKLVCGVVSDRIKFISEGNKFRLFNSIAFFGSASFFFALSMMGTEHKSINVILLGGAAGILGATTGGFFKSAPFLSKQYSHFVTGNISLMLTICLLAAPIIVNGLTVHQTQAEWAHVFMIIGSVQIISNIIFCICVRGEPCIWTTDDWIRKNSVKDINRIATVEKAETTKI